MTRATIVAHRFALFLSLCLVIGVPRTGRADEPEPTMPSLTSFLAAAERHAAANVEASAIVEQREREKEQAIFELLPSVSASVSYTHNQVESGLDLPTGENTTQRVIITPQDQLDATLRLDITLLDVRALYGIGAADARIAGSNYAAQSTSIDVSRAVTEAWYQRVAAEAIERAAGRALAAAQDNARVVRVRVDAELASELDEERAKAAVQRARQTLADAMRQKALASRRLKSLTGMDASGTAPELTVEVASGEGLASYAALASGTAVVRAAQEDVRAAEILETSTWLTLVPTIEGFLLERFSNAVGFGQSPAWAVGVSATWRFDPATVGAARTDAAATRVASARLARIVQTQQDAIDDARIEIDAQQMSVLAAREEEVAARKAASVARRRYEADRATQLDVITAERDALQAEVLRIQAETNLELARAILALAIRPAKAAP